MQGCFRACLSSKVDDSKEGYGVSINNKQYIVVWTVVGQRKKAYDESEWFEDRSISFLSSFSNASLDAMVNVYHGSSTKGSGVSPMSSKMQ